MKCGYGFRWAVIRSWATYDIPSHGSQDWYRR